LKLPGKVRRGAPGQRDSRAKTFFPSRREPGEKSSGTRETPNYVPERAGSKGGNFFFGHSSQIRSKQQNVKKKKKRQKKKALPPHSSRKTPSEKSALTQKGRADPSSFKKNKGGHLNRRRHREDNTGKEANHSVRGKRETRPSGYLAKKLHTWIPLNADRSPCT